MDQRKIKRLLKEIRSGRLGIDEALMALRSLPYEDLELAKIDTHRDLRKGFPEVILCKGKTIDQIIKIVKGLKEGMTMATKANREVYAAIKEIKKDAVYYEKAQIVLMGQKRQRRGKGTILVVSAGTADIPIAEEAATTAEIMGNRVERLYDVGVAGIHRLFDHKESLFKAEVLVVVAGMEGALPSVVGGLVDRPVIAVPTSIGYGASFEGLAALLGMLNTCAPGIVVVNIDNGFGAGYFASIINRAKKQKLKT
ncbi:TPA: nickel pincer cofactor biosynthesis protein LarB [bacterium]|nr:nickel pincer cofactor biosynthesis protein LarB [bacterium]